MPQTVVTPRLSIVIVNINQKNLTISCISSIVRELGGLKAEIIVVDNDSSDGSPEAINIEFPQVKLVRHTGLKGFAENYNFGARFAQGQYLLFMNNDTEVLPLHRKGNSLNSCLDEMVKKMERLPEIACLGPMLVYPDGELQIECARNFPTTGNYFSEFLHLSSMFPKHRFFGDLNMTYWDHQDERQVPCISGAFMLLRRSIFTALGGFDDSFFLSAEDTDLCKQMNDQGLKILYCPEFKVIHVGSQTIQAARSFAGRVEAVISMYRYFLKHHGKAKAFLFRLMIIFILIPRILLLEIPLFMKGRRKKTLPFVKRLDACLHLLQLKSLYTGRVCL